ncbi:MAG: hypothetical protein AAFX99_12840 [Myxococcota bacterium]
MALSIVACSDDGDPDREAGSDTGVASDVSSSPDTVSSDTSTSDTGVSNDTVEDTTEGFAVSPRAPGERAPQTAPCDDVDPSRCLLPWPSDRFVQTDPTTATGLRVALAANSVLESDDVTSINAADGHSRNSPVLTVFEGAFDPTTVGDRTEGAMRVVVSEPGPWLGEVVPMRFNLLTEEGNPTETILVGYPRRPLRPNTEYAVAIMDTFRDMDGTPPERNALTALALGQNSPTTLDEARWAAYHAPTRAALEAAGIDGNAVVRVWSYTTRSATDPLHDLISVRTAMLEALDRGEITFRIDETESDAAESIAAAVRGTVTVPDFVSDGNILYRSADGQPEARGTREAPFRIAIPAGEGDYRVLMYGHGFGGDVRDKAFDEVITRENAAKVNIQFDDWTEDGALLLADRLLNSLDGTDQLAAGLVESIAIGVAVQYALDGTLGDLLSANTLAGVPNPAVGRRPDTRNAIWAGGSLGGTVGLVYASLEPTVGAAVLNVPGAGFTHYLRFSNLYPVLELILRVNYKTEADRALAIAIGQINLDRIDGASWFDAVDAPPVCLIQESIGDPVLPNIGTDFLAASVDALHLGAVLHPIEGLSIADEALGVSAITQFKVPQDQSELAIHGFGDQDAPAGRAAQEQIRTFLNSVWDGAPQIRVPSLCMDNTPPGSCDFSQVE